MELPLAGAADGVQQVAGWLRTTPQGEQTWVTDPAALQDLREGLAKAAQEAAAAAAAAAAEAAAAAAAAAETTGKKGSKGDKKGLGKQGSSKTGKQQPLDQAPSASATAGAAGEVGASGTAPESDTPRVALAVDAALQQLEQRPPQSMGSIKAVQLTDADTRAVVTTREDHLLIVDYLDGSRLLQVRLCKDSPRHMGECAACERNGGELCKAAGWCERVLDVHASAGDAEATASWSFEACCFAEHCIHNAEYRCSQLIITKRMCWWLCLCAGCRGLPCQLCAGLLAV